MFALLYGLSFASFFATISHVTLYDGMFIWGMWKKATTATKDNFGDVHSRLMKKNYLSSGTSDPDQSCSSFSSSSLHINFYKIFIFEIIFKYFN
ncbi:BnaC09g40120D [Brassica napus]|uniref:BnaC09g40120D protein n=1 Tax=Brassica napus TaxID=3708 RepID=A0A078FQX4_BRANA|nr:BnaC09g40120D [Brassica napus]